MPDQPRTVWVALTWTGGDGELDCSLHATEDDAKCAVVNELHERFGESFNDYPPPDEYDPAQIMSWMQDNLVEFNWSVRPKQLPKGT